MFAHIDKDGVTIGGVFDGQPNSVVWETFASAPTLLPSLDALAPEPVAINDAGTILGNRGSVFAGPPLRAVAWTDVQVAPDTANCLLDAEGTAAGDALDVTGVVLDLDAATGSNLQSVSRLSSS